MRQSPRLQGTLRASRVALQGRGKLTCGTHGRGHITWLCGPLWGSTRLRIRQELPEARGSRKGFSPGACRFLTSSLQIYFLLF